MMSVQTTEDGTDSSLPSFSTFSAELDPTWDYYDRDRSNSDVITSQSNSNYTRPWEMETKDKGFEPFSKLPSFQSQFHSYAETNMIPEPTLPHLTPVPVPISPNSGSPGNGSLTQLTPINPLQNGLTPLSSPSFHTLTAVNARAYPLVPAPIQARDIPAINQQYLDERHIQLYQPISAYPPQNMVTVIKNEPSGYDLKNGLHHHHHVTYANHTNHTNHANHSLNENGFENMKIEKSQSPMRVTEARKKERRKIRASSLESSAESESSAMEMGDGNPGQVAAISSTANFKSPIGSMTTGDEDTNGDKQVSIFGYRIAYGMRALLQTLSQPHFFLFARIISRPKRSANVAANASAVRKKTIVVIVHRAEMIKAIRFASKDVARSSLIRR